MMRAVADLVGPDLRVLFCGINPGTLSGDLGLHFARPGNRFWKLLCAGGFTESVLSPAEQPTLPGLGIGITNLVGRVTSAASELNVDELREGAAILRPRRRSCVLGASPCWAAGVPHSLSQTRAVIGRQPELLAGALLWPFSPNPAAFRPTTNFGNDRRCTKRSIRRPSERPVYRQTLSSRKSSPQATFSSALSSRHSPALEQINNAANRARPRRLSALDRRISPR